MPLVLAISAVIGATWRWQVVEGTATLGSYKLPAALLAILVVLIFFLPLLLFTPKLIREKKEGSLNYGSLRGTAFLAVPGKVDGPSQRERGRAAKGTADVSSLADMSTSFKNVEDMVVFPFQKGAAIALLAALALPMIPALTAKIPLKELLKSLGRPSLMASLRANCISPSRPFTSVEIRFEVVTYLNEGTPMAMRIAMIAW